MRPGSLLSDTRLSMGLWPSELWEVMATEMWRNHREGLPSRWDHIYDTLIRECDGQLCSDLPNTRGVRINRMSYGMPQTDHRLADRREAGRRSRFGGTPAYREDYLDLEDRNIEYGNGSNRYSNQPMGNRGRQNHASQDQGPRNMNPIPGDRRPNVPAPRASDPRPGPANHDADAGSGWAGDEGWERRRREEDAGFW
ncbi:MAG: hypothetical protein Q9218_004533 [Villophora microphyllina]